jgi:4-amino-4-deoxy-L-arabinose transferase-like glycosyltransferase
MERLAREGIPHSTWMWIALFMGAILAYSLGLAHEGFWYDEAYSAAMVEHPMPEILSLAASDVHPPLYYLLLRCMRLMLGNSEASLRFLSVLGAVAFVGLGAGPVRRLFGLWTSALYAAVALSTPAILIYAHEARMYSLLIPAVTASALYGYLAARDDLRRDWIVFGLSSLAAAYLHHYGAIAVFYVVLSLGISLLARRAKTLRSLVVTVVCVFLGYLPGLVFFAGQARDVRQGFWIPHLNGRMVVGGCLVSFAYKDFHPEAVPWLLVTGAAALGIAIAGAILARTRRAQTQREVMALTRSVFLGTLITGALVSVLLAPVFFPRYMLACTGLVVLGVSLAISVVPSRPIQVAIVGLLAALNLPVIRDVYSRQFNGSMREVARDYRDQIKPGDLIVHVDSQAMGPSMYYFPGTSHVFCVPTLETPWEHSFKVFEPGLAYRQHLVDLLSSRTSFWLIRSNWQYASSLAEALKGSPYVWQRVMQPVVYASPYSRFEFSISRYARSDQTALPPHSASTTLSPAGPADPGRADSPPQGADQ